MENIAKYIFEAGMLKHVKRSGWWACKIKDPESVAEHSFRAAIVAFIIAKLEGESDEFANKLAAAAVFHDMHETRILDLNKVVVRYIDKQEAISKKVEEEQIKLLSTDAQSALKNLIFNLNEREKTILKDADLLEVAIQAKEYLEIGYKDCEGWISNVEKRLKTKSAKSLLQQIKKMDSKEWYVELKKLD